MTTDLPKGVIIRSAAPDDADSIHSFVKSIDGLDTHTPYTYWVILEFFGKLTRVAIDDQNQIAGWVCAVAGLAGDESRSDRGLIWQIAVGRDWRGTGLAKRLAEEAFDALSIEGLSTIEVTIAESNAPSNALFRSLAEERNWSLVSEELTDVAGGVFEVLYRFRRD